MNSSEIRGFYTRSTRHLVAYVAEARVQDVAQRHSKHIRSGENGMNDFGIFMGSPTPQGSPTEKLFELMDKARPDQRNIVPIEIKDIGFSYDGTPSIYWICHITLDQWDTAQAVILTAAGDPDFIAVIPTHYLREKSIVSVRRNKDSVWIFWTVRPSSMVHPLPAFPDEVSPFMMPLEAYPDAQSNIEAFARGEPVLWTNAYTGFEYEVPLPKQFELSKLLNTQLSQKNAFDLTWLIYRHVHQHSDVWRLELLPALSMLGDFKLVNILEGTEVIVELKACQCSVNYDQNGKIQSFQHDQRAMTHTDRQIFTWKSQWDFIWTKFDSDRALLLARDLIPSHWWNAPLQAHHTDRLDWPLERIGDLSNYIINESSPRQLIKDLHRILNLAKTRHGSYNAQTTIPIGEIYKGTAKESRFEMERAEDDNESTIRVAKDDCDERDLLSKYTEWVFHQQRKGLGSSNLPQLRGSSFEQSMADAIQELCRRSGQTLLLSVGKRNNRCRFLLIRYVWSKLDKARYDADGTLPRRVYNCNRRTPAIPLGFIRMESANSVYPKATRVTESAATRIRARPPTMIICDLFPASCRRLDHGRFLFPSEELPSTIEYRKDVEFRNGLMDQYLVDQDLLMETITDLTGNVGDSSEIVMGICDTPVNMKKYCCYLEDVYKDGVAANMEMDGDDSE